MGVRKEQNRETKTSLTDDWATSSGFGASVADTVGSGGGTASAGLVSSTVATGAATASGADITTIPVNWN